MPTKRDTEPITIRLPVEQIEELRKRAEQNYRPLGHEVSRALDEMFEREPVKDAA